MNNLDPNNFITKMRLNTGDFLEDEEYLTDAIYVHFYNESGHSIVDGSILALESIINNIALTPQKWSIGDASETAPLVETLTLRLEALKGRQNNHSKAPVIIKSDRNSWCDFEKVFGKQY